MNETLTSIKNRRSIRKFKPEQIGEKELEAIMEAAIYAPSAMNQQKWHFTVIQNPEILAKLVKTTREKLLKSPIEFFREREGRDFVEPSDMIVGDVDNDGTVEIITNDGYVLDTSSLNIEWATDGFGYPISLFDIDDDGVPEIVGEVGGAVQFWDAEDQREIW